MVRNFGRKMLWAYALLMLIAAVGYARYDTYMMDGDGTAFMDIAQYLNTHRANLAINGYWNPGYPALLALAERLAHPSLWRELVIVRYTNVAIFGFAMAACVFFTTGLTRAREFYGADLAAAIPSSAMHLLGLGLLTLSLARELPVAAPRADTLLLALLLLAGGLLLRTFTARRKIGIFAALGLTLGCAYLTKSFAFLPSVALILAYLVYALWRPAPKRGPALFGTAIFAAVFAVVAGPYILAISHQLGHFSTGESARLNYAFFIDMTPRWHEWFNHDLGHAAGTFVHPEVALATQPPVFSYAAHPYGTFPLWFDPAWWTLGIKPHVWLAGHIYRFARNCVVFLRYLLGRPEIFVLLGVLLAFGSKWPSRDHRLGSSDIHRSARLAWVLDPWFATPVAWGVLMLAIYFPVDLQDRYLTAPLFLVILPLFAVLHRGVPNTDPNLGQGEGTTCMRPIANALILLFAAITLVQSATYIADRRRHIPPAEQTHPGFDPQTFTAAAALDRLGLKPGDKVACMGDLTCYTDFYWARLAGTQILGQVDTPNEANPLTEWNSIPDKRTVTAPLANMGLRYIVAMLPNSTSKPEGWIQLGESNFFAYPLQAPVDPNTAHAIGAFSPQP